MDDINGVTFIPQGYIDYSGNKKSSFACKKEDVLIT